MANRSRLSFIQALTGFAGALVILSLLCIAFTYVLFSLPRGAMQTFIFGAFLIGLVSLFVGGWWLWSTKRVWLLVGILAAIPVEIGLWTVLSSLCG